MKNNLDAAEIPARSLHRILTTYKVVPLYKIVAVPSLKFI